MGRILIVDPSLLDRKRMATVLEAAGHEVLEAASPAEARAAVLTDDDPVDLILTEQFDDDETGPSVLTWLGQESRWPMAPVIVVTASSPRERVIQLVAAGAETVVTKPFAPELLLRRVTEALVDRGTLGSRRAARSGLAEQLRRELKRAVRFGSPLSLLVLRLTRPLDRGSADGLMDAVSQVLRGSDLVAQVGRDAVAVLLPEAGASGAAAVAARLTALADARTVGPKVRKVGIAAYPEDGSDGTTLMEVALDRASRE